MVVEGNLPVRRPQFNTNKNIGTNKGAIYENYVDEMLRKLGCDGLSFYKSESPASKWFNFGILVFDCCFFGGYRFKSYICRDKINKANENLSVNSVFLVQPDGFSCR